MKYLIVGLGNIGPEYTQTRHNIGFMMLDAFAAEHQAKLMHDKLGQVGNFSYRGKQVYLLKPNTYMNLSGKAVAYWQQKIVVAAENILILVDDLALDFGVLRLRTAGGAAGHNGLKSIESYFGKSYSRLRFGIGDDFAPGRQADYVLSDFTSKEQEALGASLYQTTKIMESFLVAGPALTMTQFNNHQS